jgi:hypothetical protein
MRRFALCINNPKGISKAEAPETFTEIAKPIIPPSPGEHAAALWQYSSYLPWVPDSIYRLYSEGRFWDNYLMGIVETTSIVQSSYYHFKMNSLVAVWYQFF